MKFKTFFNQFALIASCSFLIMLAIFVGCQKDFTATDLVVKSASASKYQKWFEAYTSMPKNANFVLGETFKGKIEPIWEKSIQINEHLLEIPFKLDGKGVSRNFNKSYQEGKVSLTLRANTNGTFKGFVVAITPSKGFTGSVDRINIQNFKEEKFDGIISLYNLSGNYLDGYLVKGGKILGKIKHDDTARRNNETRASSRSCGDWTCDYYEEYWCQCVCQGQNYSCRNGYNCTPPECRTSTETVCYYETNNCGGCPDPSYPNCGNCPDPANPNCDAGCPNPNDPNCDGGCGGCSGDDDDRIIEDNLSPCNSNVLAMILNSNKLKDMTDMIKVFRNDVNNNFKISEERMFNQGGTQDMLTDATTVYNQNTSTYEVTLNINVMENASKEYIAVTIMHEIIHAYMGAYWGTVRNNDTQHPLMVECYFVNLMANSLESLFPSLSQQDAMAMAWYGFDQTPSWNNFTILEKLGMQNINDAHKNHTNGTPCP